LARSRKSGRKPKRAHLYTEAVSAVEAFGSEEMRRIIAALQEDEVGTPEDRMRAFDDRFVEQARREVGPEQAWLTTSTHLPGRSANQPT
jgi:hypothetical protein